ncbi:MAG: phytoene desaturase family protein [Spirochaetota bacterium]
MKRIAIVGGGVAGLSAGIYAAQNGFDPLILEQHRIPGGLCTGWDRRGPSGRFTMEGCIHYVLGLAGTGPFRRMWDELGVDRPVLPASELFTLRHPSGAALPVCADTDELAARMRAISPGDAPAISRFVSDVKLFARYELPIDAPAEIPRWDKLASLGRHYPAFLASFLRYRFTSARAYARRFRHPVLRWAVARLGSYPDYPAVWMLMILSRMHRGEAGYPIGGSLELSYDLEERLLELGGTIRYGTRVVGLRTYGRAANGVLLDTGEIVDADVVLSAGDLRATLEWMRDARIPSRSHELMLAALRPGRAVAQVSLGVLVASDDGPLVARLSADEGASLVLYPDRPLAGMPAYRMVVRRYHDETLAPNRCRVITCQIETDFAAWAANGGDRGRYRTAKQRLAGEVIRFLERTGPRIAECVEVTDVATPLTTERYTLNYRGSVHGTRPDRVGFAWPASYRGPRGSRLFFAGHWLCPGGGIHRAAQSGRYAIQTICAALGRDFRAAPARSAFAGPALLPDRRCVV